MLTVTNRVLVQGVLWGWLFQEVPTCICGRTHQGFVRIAVMVILGYLSRYSGNALHKFLGIPVVNTSGMP